MPRRVVSLAIAVTIVAVRLLAGGGGVARAAAAEPAVRGELGRASSVARPQRPDAVAARAARVVVDELGLVPAPVRVDEPRRALAPATVIALAPAVVPAPAPPTGARAPPR